MCVCVNLHRGDIMWSFYLVTHCSAPTDGSVGQEQFRGMEKK